MQARNAHFNLNRLGVTVGYFADNFYGTDYNADPTRGERPGLQSDRLFANWNLSSSRVNALATGSSWSGSGKPLGAITIPGNWTALVREDIVQARGALKRVRTEFKQAFQEGLVLQDLNAVLTNRNTCSLRRKTPDKNRFCFYSTRRGP
jgi:predicted GNAT superfamily acetyltransferase